MWLHGCEQHLSRMQYQCVVNAHRRARRHIQLSLYKRVRIKSTMWLCQCVQPHPVNSVQGHVTKCKWASNHRLQPEMAWHQNKQYTLHPANKWLACFDRLVFSAFDNYSIMYSQCLTSSDKSMTGPKLDRGKLVIIMYASRPTERHFFQPKSPLVTVMVSTANFHTNIKISLTKILRGDIPVGSSLVSGISPLRDKTKHWANAPNPVSRYGKQL